MTSQENINNILTNLTNVLQTLKDCEMLTLNEIKQIEQLKIEKAALKIQLQELNKELDEKKLLVGNMEMKRRKFLSSIEAEEEALVNKLQSIRSLAENWTNPVIKEEEPIVEVEIAEEERKRISVAPKVQPEPAVNNKIAPKKSSSVKGAPVSDLNKAIGLNDRLLFIKELFKGNSDSFAEMLKHLNKLTSMEEAQQHIELTIPHWDSKSETARLFLAIISRRYL